MTAVPTASAIINQTRQFLEDRQRTAVKKTKDQIAKEKKLFWTQTFGAHLPSGIKPENTERFRRFHPSGGGGNKRQKKRHGGGGGGAGSSSSSAAAANDEDEEDDCDAIAAGQ